MSAGAYFSELIPLFLEELRAHGERVVAHFVLFLSFVKVVEGLLLLRGLELLLVLFKQVLVVGVGADQPLERDIDGLRLQPSPADRTFPRLPEVLHTVLASE